ncbi:hypothetical protein TNIN_247391 [Trichonephila inaurata madagascariensis]|uniref:Uncharacterized protein n=1 Tax=Trichonephila inaurata madagascariensis TaxID=2747483 RepID=A0A8X6WYG5_9ARAC|nr:hypothetical protein TNIN_247391 [Trichonephila inaurata madagascariensis]
MVPNVVGYLKSLSTYKTPHQKLKEYKSITPEIDRNFYHFSSDNVPKHQDNLIETLHLNYLKSLHVKSFLEVDSNNLNQIRRIFLSRLALLRKRHWPIQKANPVRLVSSSSHRRLPRDTGVDEHLS